MTTVTDPHNDWRVTYGAATSFKALLGKELAVLTSAGMMDQLFDWYLGEERQLEV